MITKKKKEIPSVYGIISVGVTLTGDLQSKDDLRIDGNIQGNIYCDGKIVIGDSGYVTGNISCSSLELFGRIHGDVRVSGLFSLHESSEFRGEAAVVDLEIEPKARFIGTSKILNIEEKAEAEEID
jgi:cytoskeletal protein CcmA (bactofilin family)